MYIKNIADEVVPQLRGRLRDYLSIKLGIDKNARTIKCFVHDDKNPSMTFDHKQDDTVIHCFSCGANMDIFAAASHIEGMPMSGPEWITETIPHLANMLDIELDIGEASALHKERAKLYKLAQDIENILRLSPPEPNYTKQRNWYSDDLTISSIDAQELTSKLEELGWEHSYIQASCMVFTERHSFFGTNKITFTMKDYRGRPVAFISRNISDMPKYIHTPETPIFSKSKTLMGLDVALKQGNAKKNGIHIVEGPGDLTQLYRLGIYNAVAICGVAFTKEHFQQLKMIGINTLYFSLDWDDAGRIGTHRILKEALSDGISMNCFVVMPPSGDAKDIDALLSKEKNGSIYAELKRMPAFEWMLSLMSDLDGPEQVCAEMIPIISAESTAVGRELMAKKLSQHTHIGVSSILQDVEGLRSGVKEERKQRIRAATKKYQVDSERDPENIFAIMAQHQKDLEYIEQDYSQGTIGPAYQLSRFDSLQTQIAEGGDTATNYNFGRYTLYGQAFSGGLDSTSGVLTYLGGHQNSGKTATGLALMTDIALNDPDAVVIGHFTDDTYKQVEPRIKGNIAEFIRAANEPQLPIGIVYNPNRGTDEQVALVKRAHQKMRELISMEKLMLIDSENGKTLTTLEAIMRYARTHYPSKKIFVFQDNTHKLRDFIDMDANSRMQRIADTQKDLSGKYGAHIMATVEYRKRSGLIDPTKMLLPSDDDIADSRAAKYDASAIIHVYNDLNDRPNNAELYWTKPSEPEKKLPRLMLMVTKNKITEFKHKLMMDLDPVTVTLRQRTYESVVQEHEIRMGNQAPENAEQARNLTGPRTIFAETDYDE